MSSNEQAVSSNTCWAMQQCCYQRSVDTALNFHALRIRVKFHFLCLQFSAREHPLTWCFCIWSVDHTLKILCKWIMIVTQGLISVAIRWHDDCKHWPIHVFSNLLSVGQIEHCTIKLQLFQYGRLPVGYFCIWYVCNGETSCRKCSLHVSELYSHPHAPISDSSCCFGSNYVNIIVLVSWAATKDYFN